MGMGSRCWSLLLRVLDDIKSDVKSGKMWAKKLWWSPLDDRNDRILTKDVSSGKKVDRNDRWVYTV